MNRLVERTRNLSAFSIELSELEVLWNRMIAAFAQCRECGRDVSTEAEKCPHCGAPTGSVWTKKRSCLPGCVVILSEKKHEREVESLLIRTTGPLLEFNDRKRRENILTGDMRDFEAGTLFYQRQRKRGKKRKKNNKKNG